MQVQVQQIDRRYYLVNAPFGVKDEIKRAGCRWDPDRRSWWTGKRDVAEGLVAKILSAPSTAAAATSRKAPGEDAVVAGKVKYKGRAYYVAGRVERGRTHYDDRVTGVTTRDGAKVLLYSLDGSLEFWANRELTAVVKRYDRPQTIGGLRRFAEQIRGNGGIYPDACPHCGSLSCSTAYGRDGLCDED